MDEEPNGGNDVAEVDNGVGDVPALVQHRADRLASVSLRQDV